MHSPLVAILVYIGNMELKTILAHPKSIQAQKACAKPSTNVSLKTSPHHARETTILTEMKAPNNSKHLEVLKPQ